jgi:ATP-dependent Clp protease protease subunit
MVENQYVEKTEEEMPEKEYGYVDVENRIIYVFGDIELRMAAEIAMAVPELRKNSSVLTVKISSSGGDINSGIIIINSLKSIGCAISMDVISHAYSMAAYLLFYADSSSITRYGSIMLHSPILSGDTAETLENSKMSIEFTHERWNFFLKETLKNKSLAYAKYKKNALGADWYLTPMQAVKLGIIDEIY